MAINNAKDPAASYQKPAQTMKQLWPTHNKNRHRIKSGVVVNKFETLNRSFCLVPGYIN